MAAGPAEQRRGDEQHREIDQAGRAERGQHVDLLEAQQLAPLGIVAAAHPGFRQRGVQVDHVRHHRGPDDPGNEQQPVAGQAWYQPGRDVPRAGPDRGQVVGETEEDDAEQAGDRQLERPVAALLQGQDAERDHRRDQPGRQHRHVEEQTQPQRGPDELGQVRRHGDELAEPTGRGMPSARTARGTAPAGRARWRHRSWRRGTAPAWPSGWPPRSPMRVRSRTSPRPRSWWRSYPDRRRPPRRRTPGRAGPGSRGPAHGTAASADCSAALSQRTPPQRRPGTPGP